MTSHHRSLGRERLRYNLGRERLRYNLGRERLRYNRGHKANGITPALARSREV